MKKLMIATIAMGFFLISTQAAGSQEYKDKGVVKSKTVVKSKVVTAKKAAKPKAKPKTVAKAKVVKDQKKKVTMLDFGKKEPVTMASHKVKPMSKKKFKAIYCADGYIVKNQAFCAIASKDKVQKPMAKKLKATRSVASQKDLEVKKQK